ncbi:MAG: V-type ATP synthase subunit F [Clostridia bacterium]
MADIVMIGDRDSVLLAKAAGLLTYGIENPEDAKKLIVRLAKEETKIIFITEPVFEICREVINRYKTAPFPAIIPVPDGNGSSGAVMKELKANVEKAIGVDILFAEES